MQKKYFTYSKKTLCSLKTQDNFSAQNFGHDVSRETIHNFFWGASHRPSPKSNYASICPRLKSRVTITRTISYGKGVQKRYVRFSLFHRHTIYLIKNFIIQM